MSWYGMHPQRTKEEVKAVLPLGICKECVYWYRTMPGIHSLRYRPVYRCTRCGIDRHKYSNMIKRLLEEE